MHKIFLNSFYIIFLSMLLACGAKSELSTSTESHSEIISLISNENMANLPIAITNNAVASVELVNQTRLYSFLGLEQGKEWSDISTKVFRYSNGKWKRIRDASLSQGRLASVAVTVKGFIYLLGGYTVSEDHSEVSTPEVLRFDPLTEEYERVADIPIPSDDSVALVYQDRYIYLISGWHNKGNISLVQVYDAFADTWKQATQFPGSPVFGHAGGIVGNKMIVCDGVKIKYPELSAGEEAKRDFVMSDECYQGRIDSEDPYLIHWSVVPNHPGAARYRVAAIGDEENNRVLFVGGSNNPYNFNGIGYNGVPSQPVSSIFSFDFESNSWQLIGKTEFSTMDHRGLLKLDGRFVTVGGMDSKQKVLTETHSISIPSK